jgi:hypothetical protein
LKRGRREIANAHASGSGAGALGASMREIAVAA